MIEVCDNYKDLIDYDHPNWLEYSLYKGTPLPKHHGRLIDADALEQEMIIAEGKAEGGCDYYMTDVIDRAKEYIIDAETIIPATKEGAE